MMTGNDGQVTTGLRATTAQAVGWYYLGTIGFLLVDLLFGWNVRITAFENTPLLKYAWYSGLVGCGVLTQVRPQSSSLVALVESSAYLALLLGGILLSFFGVIDAALAGSFDGLPFTPERIINAGVSGFALVGGIYTNPLMKGRIEQRR